MTNEEILDLPGANVPALLADGRMGMLVRYPGPDGQCGFQVPGEEEIRWVHASDLEASSMGALRQRGAPPSPTQLEPTGLGQLLAANWARLAAEWL
jgi:hypothetical protein